MLRDFFSLCIKGGIGILKEALCKENSNRQAAAVRSGRHYGKHLVAHIMFLMTMGNFHKL